MHQYGDENVDWKGINDAAEYIGLGLLKWGRLDVRQWKEKFGTVRVYCSFGINSWNQLTHPGDVFYRWPRWTWRFQQSPGWFFVLLNKLVVPYQKWLYRHFYAYALLRWPHLAKEILKGCDYHELLGAEIIDQTIWWPWNRTF